MNSYTLLTVALPVAVLALFVSLVALIVRGRTPEQRVQLVARIVMWGSWGVGAMYALVAARDIYRTLFSVNIPVRIAVSPFWPVIPKEVTADYGTARVHTTLLGDGFSDATVHITGLSTATRGVLALETFAVMLAVVVLCLLLARIARGVAHGKLFDAVRARELVTAGAIFAISGFTALLANGFGHAAVMSEAMPRQISFDDMTWTALATDAHTQVFGIVSWSWALDVQWWIFIAAGVVLIAAMVVRRGNQLETDNKGLI